jgi:hypothetical protein
MKRKLAVFSFLPIAPQGEVSQYLRRPVTAWLTVRQSELKRAHSFPLRPCIVRAMLWSIPIYQLKYRGSATTMSNPFLSQTTILLLVCDPLMRDLLCEVLENAG